MEEINKINEELENFEMVKYRIKQEGFDYCFKHYSSFTEIKDKEFHKLRKNYLNVSKKIEDYINNKIENLNNKIEEYEDI